MSAGHLVFFDSMEHEQCPASRMSAIYKRLNRCSLGSFCQYRKLARLAGSREIEIIDLSSNLALYYRCVLEELLERRAEVDEAASASYVYRD